jgi:hypothetical protein
MQLIPTIKTLKSDQTTCLRNSELPKCKKSNGETTDSNLTRPLKNMLKSMVYESKSESEDTKPTHVKPKTNSVLSDWAEFRGNGKKSKCSKPQAKGANAE